MSFAALDGYKIIEWRLDMEKKSLEKNRKFDARVKKKVAKYGMAVSMGALLVTGFTRGQTAKALHVGSGFALIGFSCWHYSLYQPGQQKG